jgi:MerR family transcriptional regulator, light-induced transcriptional regulator
MRNLFGRERHNHEPQAHVLDGSEGKRYAASVAALAIAKVAKKNDGRALIAASEVRAFALLAVEANGEVVEAFVTNLVQRGVSVERIYLELLSPALKLLGDMWNSDEVNFSHLTLAFWKLQKALFFLEETSNKSRFQAMQFVDQRAPEAKLGRILIASVPGSQHTFGVQILADIFRRNGWYVELLQLSSHTDILKAVVKSNFDVIGFSIGSETLIPTLNALVKDVRRSVKTRMPSIIAGGPIFDGSVFQTEGLDVDYKSSDANAALEWAFCCLKTRKEPVVSLK